MLHKPFQVLCQFTDPAGRATLSQYIRVRNVYPAGRLDFDSEGLVVLTDDGQIQARIADPRHKMRKRYLCQVSGLPTALHTDRLLRGVALNDGPARALEANAIEPPDVHPRTPPVRHPHATGWIEVVIAEGRNRQVRRMLAAVELPVLRLIRTEVGPWHLNALAPGEHLQLRLHAPVSAPRHFPQR